MPSFFFFFSTLIEGTEMGCYSQPWSPGRVWPHMVEAAPHNAAATHKTEGALWSSDNHVPTILLFPQATMNPSELPAGQESRQ